MNRLISTKLFDDNYILTQSTNELICFVRLFNLLLESRRFYKSTGCEVEDKIYFVVHKNIIDNVCPYVI